MSFVYLPRSLIRFHMYYTNKDPSNCQNNLPEMAGCSQKHRRVKTCIPRRHYRVVSGNRNCAHAAMKRDLARRNLFESLYNKQPLVSRSQTFISQSKYTDSEYGINIRSIVNSSTRKLVQTHKQNSARIPNASKSSPDNAKYKTGRWTTTPADGIHKYLDDKNNSSSKSIDSLDVMTLNADTSDDADSFGIPEDIYGYLLTQRKLPRPKGPNNPIKVKHRPITPGLIETLNTMKVSSRTKTECWLKQLPTEKRSYHVGFYKVGCVDNDTDNDLEQFKSVKHKFIYKE